MSPKTIPVGFRIKCIFVVVSIAILAVLTGAIALAGFEKADWKYLRVIIGDNVKANQASETYATVRLDEQVYNRCEKTFADLRIIDRTGKEVPYKLIEAAGDQSTSEQNTRIVNMSVKPGNTSFSLDVGEQRWIHNRVVLDIPESNFVAHVRVEGSNDDRKWNVLSEKGFVYDISSQVSSASNREISYPDTDYRFLHITVSNNDKNSISVSGARVGQVKVTPSIERKVIEAKAIFKKVGGRSRAEIDLKYRQPSNRIEIETNDTNFYREVKIYCSDDARGWVLLGNEMIYKFDTPSYKSSKLSVNYRFSNYRYMMIEVVNADDQPIAIDNVKIYDYERSLLFPLRNKPLHLYYGKSKASKPTYDIEKVFPFIDVESAVPMKLGREKSNPSYAMSKKPWTERNPTLFWLLLIAAGAILAVLSFRLMRQITSGKV